MHKQLSKKSHKQTESSVEDFMKHIRKYNLQSERYISPKPLLYMYTNPSRNFTQHTLDKSRSKSKTLSNRKCSHSKKSSSKTIRKKVQKLLSSNFSKQNIYHKKSLSSISNVNKYADKSVKKLNKSTAEMDLTKSRAGLKSKLNDFKLRPVSTLQSGNKKKNRKSQHKFQHPTQASIYHRPLQSSIPSQSSQFYPSSIPNPAQLIQSYSNKLFKTQLYLQSTKQNLGSFLCRKFQGILNQIVESLVQNLKKSLNELQKQVQDRVSRKIRLQYEDKLREKNMQVRQLEKICQKMTKKFTQLLHKEYYNNKLIYSLRLRGVDIDREFGKAVWSVDDLGGMGYGNEGDTILIYHNDIQNYQRDEKSQYYRQNKKLQGKNTKKIDSPSKPNPLLKNYEDNSKSNEEHNSISQEQSKSDINEQDFQFQPHPSQISHKKQPFVKQTYRNNRLTKMQVQQQQQHQQEIVNIEYELQQQQESYEHQYYRERQHQNQTNAELNRLNKSL